MMKRLWVFLTLMGCIGVAQGTDVLRKTSVVGLSLGDGFYPGDLSAIPLNPAGAGLLDGAQVQASYTLLYGGARFNVLGFGDRFGPVRLSLQMAQLYRDGIELRENLADPFRTTTLSQTGVVLCGAMRAPLGIAAGVGIKTLSVETCGVRSPWTIGGDAGVYRELFSAGSVLTNRLSVGGGIALSNVVRPRIVFDAEEESVPMDVRLSLHGLLTLMPRYDLARELLGYDRAGLFCDYTSRGISLGAEYRRGNIAVRTGWAAGTYGGYTLGFGARLGVVMLNYAFVPFVGIGMHSLEMAYEFGTRRKTGETPEELEDMLAVQRKAERIHDRYVREAEELIRSQRYAPARDLLVRVIPARPDKTIARDLQAACEAALSAERLGTIHTAFIAALNAGLFPDALDQALAAVDVAPHDATARAMLVDIRRDRPISPTQRSLMRTAEQRYVDKLIVRISTAVGIGDFAAADAAWERLNEVRPTAEETYTQKRVIESAKRERADELVRNALQASRDGNHRRAYRLFAAAYRLTGDDAVRIQRDTVAGRLPRPSLYSGIYERKLYYTAAAAFAADEGAKAREAFFALRERNPVYDAPLLENALIGAGLIERHSD